HLLADAPLARLRGMWAALRPLSTFGAEVVDVTWQDHGGAARACCRDDLLRDGRDEVLPVVVSWRIEPVDDDVGAFRRRAHVSGLAVVVAYAPAGVGEGARRVRANFAGCAEDEDLFCHGKHAFLCRAAASGRPRA